ncbi:EutN/CcmL family microcompartment protein [Mucisphaera calidilacus]|uniref:Ethanolamine utilization protein EutN n=1 Tax=Mucisphaera calidilacus TaxID=2527982 RepID=A0A518BYF9_9BACT|nr:EutN/CcmL family microcompartment protein [Mucisphaera calidilacus]QDU72013.1 Ethanolamine utilization protein EutN [Mucisphaera calidilacus]
MFLGRVKGQVVSTVKDESLKGTRLLIIEPLKVDYDDNKVAANGVASAGRFSITGRAIVAIDSIGAATGQVVLVTQGSSARLAEGCGKMPTDAVIVGVIDSASIGGNPIETTPAKPRGKSR